MTTASVVYWNQILPTIDVKAIEQHLSARVRDPLWMLSRQWQLGEFLGEDAGSPAFVSYTAATAPLGTWSGAAGTGYGTPVTGQTFPGGPFERALEQERGDWELPGFRAEVSDQLETMMEDAGLSATIDKLRAAYPLDPTGKLIFDGKTVGSMDQRDSDALRFLRICGNRCMDSEVFFHAIDTATRAKLGLGPGDNLPLASVVLPAIAGIVAGSAEETSLVAIVRKFGPMLVAQYGADKIGVAWSSERMEYAATAYAKTPAALSPIPPQWPAAMETAAAFAFKVEPDGDGVIDWLAFGATTGMTATEAAATGVNLTAGVANPTLSRTKVFPAHVRFRGMPNERWWDFESNEVDYGSIEPERRDLAKLLVMEFVLSHGNDWFTLPVDVGVGSVSYPLTLYVHDVFGNIISVPYADSTLFQPAEYWPVPWSVPPLFISPPSAGSAVQESAPVEEVHLVRDNLAEMCWAIEAQTTNGVGQAWNAQDRALAPDPSVPAAPPATPPASTEPQAPSDIPLQYLIETSVPENWIPVMPVQADATSGRVVLLRSAIERFNQTTGNLEDVPPSTRVVNDLPNALDEQALAEEELPNEGLTVTRFWNRARWTDGTVHLWVSRGRKPGVGGVQSGLAYDTTTTG